MSRSHWIALVLILTKVWYVKCLIDNQVVAQAFLEQINADISNAKSINHNGRRYKRNALLPKGSRFTWCQNPYRDIGLCLPAGECKATRGVTIGSCQFLHESNFNAVCCQHLPCSTPEVKGPQLEATLELGVRNQLDLRTRLGTVDLSSVSPGFIQAELQNCGIRHFKTRNTRTRQDQSAIVGRDGHIINGHTAISNVPWMLALWIRTGEPGKDIPTCGAALISSEYALTAAHCVGNKNTNFFLRGGSNFNHLNGKSLEIEISHIITHPSFNPFNFEFDIALIKFRWPITFTRNLFPVCLPPPPATAFPNEEILTDYTGDRVTVHGWGCLNEKCKLGVNIPTMLQEASLNIVANDLAMCWFQNDSVTRGNREYIPSKLFLVGGDGHSGTPSTCKGDSGSPVVRRRHTQFGQAPRWEMIGLVSWSKGCGRRFRPSVWTRVETFVDWIEENMTSS